MEKTIKITLKFKCSEEDIQLFKVYNSFVNGLKKQFGTKITVLNGINKTVFHRNQDKQWEKVHMHDIIILCERPMKDKIMEQINSQVN